LDDASRVDGFDAAGFYFHPGTSKRADDVFWLGAAQPNLWICQYMAGFDLATAPGLLLGEILALPELVRGVVVRPALVFVDSFVISSGSGIEIR
jgi:hypothetical protein